MNYNYINDQTMNVRIVRIYPKNEVDKKEGKYDSATKIAIDVLIWTKYSDLCFEFIKLDSSDDCRRVYLEIALKKTKNTKPLKNLVPVRYCETLEDEINGKLKFDKDYRDLFEISIKSFLKPDGVKRTVVTYEETDIIDDSKV